MEKEIKFRDYLAMPFSIIMFLFGLLAVQIGGIWTAKQIRDVLRG